MKHLKPLARRAPQKPEKSPPPPSAKHPTPQTVVLRIRRCQRLCSKSQKVEHGFRSSASIPLYFIFKGMQIRMFQLASFYYRPIPKAPLLSRKTLEASLTKPQCPEPKSSVLEPPHSQTSRLQVYGKYLQSPLLVRSFGSSLLGALT